MLYPRTNGAICPVSDLQIEGNQSKMDELLKKLQLLSPSIKTEIITSAYRKAALNEPSSPAEV